MVSWWFPKACAGGSDLSRPGMCDRLGARWDLATCHGPVEMQPHAGAHVFDPALAATAFEVGV